MRKLFPLLFLLQFYQLHAADVWQHFFGGDKTDAVSKVLIANGGGWIAVGYTESYGDSGYNIHVTKWDADGKMIWQKVIGAHFDEYGYSAAQDASGNIYVAGKTNAAGTAGGYDAYLLKLNSTGDFIWQHTYGGINDDYAKAIVINSLNQIVLTGGTMSLGAGATDVYLLCTDTSGNVLWSKTFGSAADDYANAIVMVHDGGYIIAGKTTGFSTNYGYVVRTDINGDSLWTNAYNIGLLYTSEIFGVTELSNTCFIYTGYGNDYSYGNMFHMKTDLAGIVSYTRYSSLLADAAYDVVSTSDGGYATVGVSSNFGSRTILTKFNAAGDKEWQRTYRYNDSGTYPLYTDGLSLVQNADGSYTIGGSSGLNNTCNSYYDAFIMKADNSGISVPTLLLPVTSPTGLNFCDTASVNATLIAPPGYNAYQWFKLINGVNIKIDDSVSQSYSTSVAGTYFCLLSFDDGAYFTMRTVVSVIPLTSPPVVSPSGIVRRCQAMGHGASLSTSSITGMNYQWLLNGAPIAGATNYYYAPVIDGLYDVTISNNCGSQTSADVQVYNSSGLQGVTIASSGSTDICAAANQTTLLTSSETFYGFTYTWLLNDTVIAATGNATFYSPLVTGNYSIIVDNGCGPDTSNVITINANAPPSVTILNSHPQGMAVFSSTGTNIYCGYDTLNASYANYYSTYTWRLGGNTVFGNTYVYHASQPGYYSVEITNACGTVLSDSILVNAIPGNDTLVTNSSSCTLLQLAAPSSGNSNSYQWYLNGDTIVFGIYRNFSTLTGGSFYCTFKPDGCPFSIPTNTVTLSNPIGRPQVAASPALNICSGTVQLSVNTNNAAYTWKRNSAIIPGATSQSYTATQTGNYTCIVSLTGCSDDSTSAAVIIGSTAIVARSQFVCPQNGTVLNPEVLYYHPATYQWRLNGSPINGATSIYYTATQAGTYDLNITDTCGSYITNAITLSAVSTSLSPSGTIRLCDGSSATLSAPTGPGFTYLWRINSTYILTATDSVFTVGPDNFCCSSGTVNVKMFIPGCYSNNSDYVTIIRTSNLINNIFASSSPQLCGNVNVQLNARLSDVFSYQWYKDSVFIPLATDSVYLATIPGDYYVSITDTFGCSTNSNAIAVSNTHLDGTIDAQGSQTLCSGTILLSLTPAANNYQWYKDGNLIPGATSQNYLADTSGMFSVAFADASGCSGSTSTSVLMYPVSPVTITSAGQYFCIGDTCILNVNQTVSQWYLNGVMIPNATSIYCPATVAGDYSVTTVDINGCTGYSDTLTLYFDTIQYAHITSPSTSLCPDSLIFLTANNGSNLSYQWKKDGNDIPGAAFITYQAISSGVYSCEITGSCGTTLSNSVTITSALNVVISANGTTNFCPGGDVTLFASPAGLQYLYQWLNNGANIPGATADTIDVYAPGNYEVQIQDANGCMNISNGITVFVEPLPIVQLGTDTTICVDDLITLDAGSGFTSYSWQDGSSGQTFSVTSAIPDTSQYSVLVTNNAGCSNGDSILVIFDICGKVNQVMELTSISVYPNPVHHNIYVKSSQATILKLTIVDVIGNELYSDASAFREKEIDMSNLVPGIYYLQLRTSNGISMKKLIRQ